MEPQAPTPQPAQLVPVQVADRINPPRRRIGLLGTILILLVLLVLGVSLLANFVLIGARSPFSEGGTIQEKYFSHERTAADKVAILSIEGTILEGNGFCKRQIDQAMKDDNVKAVVLRVDSPGGTVTGSDYLLHHLKKLAGKKPLVVSMGGIAASGGYYVSMAVGSTPDSIFAEPSTWTGSIGVIIPHYDLSKLLNEHGIQQDSIVSHPLKGIGSFTRPMTPKEREILQGLVNDSFRQFKKIVCDGRPKFQKDPATLKEIATGQVFTADQAVQLGLVDRIGFVEDAVDRAIQLADLDAGEVRVVEYKREFSLFDGLLGAESKARGFNAAALLEMATPRAYYLWTWLPAALGNGRAD